MMKPRKPQFRKTLDDCLKEVNTPTPTSNYDYAPLDPLLAQAVLSEVRATHHPSQVEPPVHPPSQSAGDDPELVQTLVTRLRQLEGALQVATVQGKERQATITNLQEKVDRLLEENARLKEAAPDAASKESRASSASSNCSAQGRPRSLWDAETPFQWQQTIPESGPTLPFDVKALFHNIKLLNRHCTPLTEVDGVHQLKTTATPLVFYQDGLCWRDGPLRPYSTVASILKDLGDGYFPTQWKSTFPNGVVIDPIDHTQQMCPKTGRPDVETIDSLQAHHHRLVTKEAFLNRLPKQVLREGRLVPVRQEVGVLMGQANHTEPVQVVTPLPADPDGTQSVTTLQVKCSHHGTHTFILHMFHDQTIGELRAAILKQMPQAPPQFALCTVFPTVVYTDPKQTLQQAQLVPTATLHARW
eukprot:NODE_1931_length_1332_cov_34.088797_g1836_i0.p1 GENE.NODE_1931_length_1332_cov_34.088797_g1836_i0~~NODE_1931_length_1332_cov_34.088797_g1836_i0.p1  ORF type:complete len:415 (-),score=105.24 NODE_1931_length_1332_cov_34.088797_g1836_i0:40-1284(-)